jgi:MFS family permease
MYNRKLIFWAACIGILFFGMAITTLGSVVSDLKNKYGLSDISVGTLFSILPFGILTGSLFFGPVCDRYGYKILLSISCICMFLGFEGIAYAPSHLILKISVFLFGLGGGAINGSTSALVSDISEKDKGANLSLLGVFFGIGALGMPFILGMLKNIFSYQSTLSAVGIATFMVGIFYLLITFPPAKHQGGFPVKQGVALLKDSFLLMVSFFLFFQSAYESIINNWITTYLNQQHTIQPDKALFALSLFSVGMGVMRLLLGSVLRNAGPQKIWTIAFVLMAAGLLLLITGNSFWVLASALVLLGAGLAGGFPIMLGFLGERFKELSGTAFSIAFTIALIGNMIINYAMGVIVQFYGVKHLMTVTVAELVCMIILCTIILKKLKTNNN